MNIKNSYNTNKGISKIVTTITIFAILSVGVVIISSVTSNNLNFALAQPNSTSNSNTTKSINNNNTSTTNNQQQKSLSLANFTRSQGQISSIQNDASGKPSWILSGQWDLAIPKPLKINQTNPPNAAIFNSGFEMIKTDGTSMHTHTISNFNLKGSSINGNALILTGTATVSMKEGPVKDVPISITILNQGALNISIDPLKTKNHFGNTPIYGTVSTVGVFLSFP